MIHLFLLIFRDLYIMVLNELIKLMNACNSDLCPTLFDLLCSHHGKID